MKNARRLWWGLLILLLISPLGLILPGAFQSGPAWGEWGSEELQKMLGFLPEGFRKIGNLWPAPVPEYSLKNLGGQGWTKGLAYLLSGALGVGAILIVSFLLGKTLTRKNQRGKNSPGGVRK